MRYIFIALISLYSNIATAQANTWIKCIHEKTYTIGNTNTGKAKTYHTGITLCYNKYAYCIITKDDKLTFTIDGSMQYLMPIDSCIVQQFINAADEVHERGDYAVAISMCNPSNISISYGNFGDYIDFTTTDVSYTQKPKKQNIPVNITTKKPRK